jgi:alkylation response protein AidB-like acyl-CoA dehydrogenase
MVSRITSGEKVGPESSLIKLMWSELHQRLTAVAAEALGTDFSLQQVWGSVSARFQDVYLQSRAETIYAGTSQIQKNIIADRVLNLPRSVS